MPTDPHILPLKGETTQLPLYLPPTHPGVMVEAPGVVHASSAVFNKTPLSLLPHLLKPPSPTDSLLFGPLIKRTPLSPGSSHTLPTNKADCPENLEKPSSKEKTAICAVVVQLIFGQDPEWQDWFVAMPKKFTISVTNCISYLHKTFIFHYRSLHQTGEGVQAGMDAANIHVTILKDFPWYDDLYAIWNGIPNFTAKLTNSQPGKSCSADFLKLIAPTKKTIPVNQQMSPLAAQVAHATDGTPHPTAVPPDEDISMWDGDELNEGVGMDEEEVMPSKVVNQGVAQKGKHKAVEPLDSLGLDFDFDFNDLPEEEQASNYHTCEASFQLMATKASITGQQSHQPLAFPTPSLHSSTPFHDAHPSASRASLQASGSHNHILSLISSGAMSNSSSNSKADS
ncbi:hypothetical protein HD554DRAFT_2246648 [Boletus coccyginus]|nr:hypothetical protein HD554DRAFT_2246648 [Boletus coccyginus]